MAGLYADKIFMSNKIQKLIFITGNAGKAKYLGDYFHLPIKHLKLDLPEIQSFDLMEIVEDKAKRAFRIVKTPVLVEDTSLVFEALGNKLPGPLIKWFFEALGNEGLCDLMKRYDNRNAVAEVQFALCDKRGVKIFSGKMKGTIARKPRGKAGFGWDPIFIPEGHTKTWAEMTGEEKHKTSMRKLGLVKMKKYLKNYI